MIAHPYLVKRDRLQPTNLRPQPILTQLQGRSPTPLPCPARQTDRVIELQTITMRFVCLWFTGTTHVACPHQNSLRCAPPLYSPVATLPVRLQHLDSFELTLQRFQLALSLHEEAEFALFGSVLGDNFRPDRSDIDALLSCALEAHWT